MASDENADDLRKRIIRRIQNKYAITRNNSPACAKRLLSTEANTHSEPQKNISMQSNQIEERKETKDMSTIKIKTLAEIRAERMMKFDQKEPDSQTNDVKSTREAEDKSNSPCEIQDKRKVSLKRQLSPVRSAKPKKIIRLKAPAISANEVSSTILDEEAQTTSITVAGSPQKKVRLIRKIAEDTTPTLETEDVIMTDVIMTPPTVKHAQEDILKLDREDKLCYQELGGKSQASAETSEAPKVNLAAGTSELDVTMTELDKIYEETLSDNNGKILDETLLLEDDDEVLSGSVQEEDELLDQIDNLLGE